MKKLFKTVVFIGIMALATTACNHQQSDDSYPIEYENELFSINLPEGWEVSDAGWNGLDSLKNEVDFYSTSAPVWFHVVKTFLPMKWKNVEEAAEIAIYARSLADENIELIDRKDSVTVGGYPASILYYANYQENDTIVQKQFVTYLEDSHIVIYFNEHFYYRNWDAAQEYGDKIIETIKIKKVVNPLENDSIVKEVLQSAMDAGQIPM